MKASEDENVVREYDITQPVEKVTLTNEVNESNVVQVTANQQDQINLLKLQFEQRLKLIKFIMTVFGSMTVFTTLVVLTGLRTEYTQESGTKYTYQFDGEALKLVVPIGIAALTAAIGTQIRDKQS